MKYTKLRKLREKLYFTIDDVVNALGIKRASAIVLCGRYVKEGIFIRLKNNFFVLEESWQGFSREDMFKISNYLQVPSYISFMTALSFYEITTQVQRNFYESASLKRTKSYDIKATVLNFYKLKKKYYFDFIRKGPVFIATKEKAFLDSMYLYSFGKYKLDFDALDVNKLDKDKIRKIMKIYPKRTQTILKTICEI